MFTDCYYSATTSQLKVDGIVSRNFLIFFLPPSKCLHGRSLFEMDSKRTKTLMFYCECMEVSPEMIKQLDLKGSLCSQYAFVTINV